MTKKKATHVSLRPEFIMSAEDKEFLSSLPNNSPEIPLTREQKNKVSNLYYKYLSTNGVFYDWGGELYNLEKKENWPSGPRVKLHEAQRIILGWLLIDNQHHSSLSLKAATDKLSKSLLTREAYRILLSKIYNFDVD